MVSEKSWSIDAVARLFLGVIVTLCCGLFLSGLLDTMKLGLSPEQLQFVQMIVLVVFFQGAALVWIAVFLRQSNISWRAAFGLRPPSRTRAVAAGLAVGVMVLPFAWLLQWISEDAMEWMKFKPVAQAAVKELQNLRPARSGKDSVWGAHHSARAHRGRGAVPGDSVSDHQTGGPSAVGAVGDLGGFWDYAFQHGQPGAVGVFGGCAGVSL